MKAKTIVLLFIPAAFCAFISMMAAFRGDNAMPAFFAFLPMCFCFAAMPLIAMNKRLTDLEEKLKQADEGGSYPASSLDGLRCAADAGDRRVIGSNERQDSI